MNRQSLKKYVFVYTGLFMIWLSCVLLWYRAMGKLPFRKVDGTEQIYISFVYIGSWFRQIFRNIFLEHRFVIPLWDSSIGFGQDVWNTFTMMLGDPLNWISAFIPRRFAETGFAWLLYVKIYLSGLAYMAYAYHKKKPAVPALVGTMVYAFSATIYIGFIQQIMIAPMYLFPILMIGVDHVWENRKPYLYIITLSLCFFNYYYFAYMMCIFVAGHCIIRYIFGDCERSIQSLGRLVGRFLLYSILGIGLAAVVILPVAYTLLSNERLSLGYTVPLIYDKQFVGGVVSGFLTGNWMGSKDCIIGFGALALPLVSYSLITKGKAIQKVEFLLLSVGLCFPFFGHVMNGFSYPANRWVWCYCMVVAGLTVEAVQQIKNITALRFGLVTIILAAYFVVSVYFFGVTNIEFRYSWIFALISWCALYIMTMHRRVLVEAALVCLTVLSCITLSTFYFCPVFTGRVEESADDNGELYESIIKSGGLPLLKYADCSDGSRFDAGVPGRVRNSTWLTSYSGMDFYMNNYNPAVTSYLNHMGMLTSPFLGGYAGQNKRSELETLAGVNYYILPKGQTEGQPYGFDTLLKEKQRGNLYTSSVPNRIMFTYKETVPWEEYEKADPYIRQQMVTHACVLDNQNSGSKKGEILFDDDEITYTLNPEDSSRIDNKRIEIGQTGDTLDLSFSPVANCEVYIYFENFKMDYSHGETAFIAYVAGRNGEEEYELLQQAFDGLTPNSHMYGGKTDWLINLGYTKTSLDNILIRFGTAGSYAFDAIKVYAKPEQEIKASLDRMHTNDVYNIKEKKYENSYTAEYNIEDERYLFMAIPYSAGWKAYVDGKKVPVLRANDGFMAIAAEPGSHILEVKYRTPWLLEGMIVTLFFLFMSVGICVFKRKEYI